MRTSQRVFLSAFLAFFLSAAAISAYAQTPLQFVPVTPCRVVDTRLPDGPFGGPALQGGTPRSFAIPQSACTIPATAAAYSLNVTVVPHGTLAYLTIWPTGQTQPQISTMNSLDGRIKANAATVSAGSPNEAVSVYATNTTDLVLDIDGYYVAAINSSLVYYPLTSCRVVDTRNSDGPLGGPFLDGDQERDFPVLDSSCIPQGVTPTAYSFNVTAVPHPSGSGLGYLTIWPQGEQRPVVSTLNNPIGTIVANAAIVAAGTGGGVAVYPNANTGLVIDIDGYFAPPAQGGLSLISVAPCRVLDTRKGGGLFSGELVVNVLGSSCGVPSTAEAYVFNATVVPQGPLGYLTLWPDGTQRPLASTLNALDGAITSNMAIVPTDNGKIDAYASGSTQLVLDISSYFAPFLIVTTTSLPQGMAGQPYPPTQLMATGGEPPYSWVIISGSLPPGLTLSDTGVISGTPPPPAAGVYAFTVQVTDALMNTASKPLGILIVGGGG
jgi:hypothetical protein